MKIPGQSIGMNAWFWSLVLAFITDQSSTAWQQNSPASAPVQYRLDVHLILIDVVVTDDDDQYLSDLQLDEVRIYEDGKLQQPLILERSCCQTSETATYSNTPAPKGPIRHPPDPQANAHETEPRTIVLLFHQAFGPIFDRLRGIKAAVPFLTTMLAPDDLVGVVVCGAELELICDLTRDHQGLAAAIAQSEPRFCAGNPVYRPSDHALRLVQVAKDHSFGHSSWQLPSRGTAGDRLLQALTQVSRGLAHVPGRKFIIVISNGLGGVNSGSSGLLARQLEREAAHNRVIVYVIDSAGLRAAAGDLRQFMLGEFLRTSSLSQLALTTGGVKQPSTNDLSRHFATIECDMRAYYVVGYRKPELTPYGYHEVRVTVTRPGAKVRYRSGYFD